MKAGVMQEARVCDRTVDRTSRIQSKGQVATMSFPQIRNLAVPVPRSVWSEGRKTWGSISNSLAVIRSDVLPIHRTSNQNYF